MQIVDGISKQHINQSAVLFQYLSATSNKEGIFDISVKFNCLCCFPMCLCPCPIHMLPVIYMYLDLDFVHLQALYLLYTLFIASYKNGVVYFCQLVCPVWSMGNSSCKM